jgi:hypothetical protein
VIHHLPTIRSQRLGFEALATIAKDAEELSSGSLEVDFSRCGFFDANMAAPLEAMLARIKDRFNAVEIAGVPPGIERILCKNRFLTSYGYEPVEDENRTTLPFRRIRINDEGRFEDYLNRHMRGKGIPKMTEGLGKVFKQSIFEVFQNAVVHSESRLGVFVCGQFYPQLQRLDLTIADAGIGIRTKVRRFLGTDISSVESIRWALQKRNSTKTGNQPGGVGLKFLKEFITHNKGKIQIASRYGFYEYDKGQEQFAKMQSDFRGTAVNVEINTGDTHAYRLASEISPENIF